MHLFKCFIKWLLNPCTECDLNKVIFYIDEIMNNVTLFVMMYLCSPKIKLRLSAYAKCENKSLRTSDIRKHTREHTGEMTFSIITYGCIISRLYQKTAICTKRMNCFSTDIDIFCLTIIHLVRILYSYYLLQFRRM